MVTFTDNLTDTGRAGGVVAKAERATTTLNALPYGQEARVVSVEGEGVIARRLMEMGVVPGAPVCVIKAAPLGDPIEVRVRGYHLALRRTEAQTITVIMPDMEKP
jgi:Fe2+ transport system protein FeoA